jgi:hypothetical protein
VSDDHALAGKAHLRHHLFGQCPAEGLDRIFKDPSEFECYVVSAHALALERLPRTQIILVREHRHDSESERYPPLDHGANSACDGVERGYQGVIEDEDEVVDVPSDRVELSRIEWAEELRL